MPILLGSLFAITTAAAWIFRDWAGHTSANVALIKRAVYRRAPSNTTLPGSTQFRELPMGSIKARGWIDAQLQTSLQGLGGQLQTFYPYVKDGTFAGGNSTYSELDEAQPYYWSAAVAAIATASRSPPDLVQWVTDTIDYVIEHQEPSGVFGPGLPNPIPWPRWLFLGGATHYCESRAAACPRVVDFMYKYANYSHALFKTGDPDEADFDFWSGARTASYVQTLQWLYEYHPRDAATQDMLLEDMHLVTKLGDLAIPDYNHSGWDGFFRDHFPTGNEAEEIQRTHGVNIAMALKDAPLQWRTTGDAKHKVDTRQHWDIVYQYHGKAAGHFAADEHLAGFGPSRGAETCQVVENMWSSSITYAIFGDNHDADRAERLAFNSLPAALTSDWWGRQYLQQENQVNSMTFGPQWPFYTDGNNSNVFGLETNYPCCTVNHPQGLPRFVSRAFLLGDAQKDIDVLHVYFVPSCLETMLAKGNAIRIEVDTLYPFDDAVHYSISADAPFVLGLRRPSWCKNGTVSQNGGTTEAELLTDDIHKLNVPAGHSTATLHLPSDVVALPSPGGQGPRNTAVFKGPLLFALPLEYKLKEMARDATQPKAVDNWRLRTVNDSYLRAIDTTTLELIRRDGWMSAPSKDRNDDIVKTTEGIAPIAIQVQGCPIAPGSYAVINDGQSIYHFPPDNATCTGPRKPLTLELYSAAKLHMAMLPTLA